MSNPFKKTKVIIKTNYIIYNRLGLKKYFWVWKNTEELFSIALNLEAPWYIKGSR